MKIIEIQDGICINVDKIDGIKEVSPMSCEVYVGTRTYISTYPYQTLLKLLNSDVIDNGTSKEEAMEKTMKKLDGVLGTMGNFAG